MKVTGKIGKTYWTESYVVLSYNMNVTKKFVIATIYWS